MKGRSHPIPFGELTERERKWFFLFKEGVKDDFEDEDYEKNVLLPLDYFSKHFPTSEKLERKHKSESVESKHQIVDESVLFEEIVDESVVTQLLSSHRSFTPILYSDVQISSFVTNDWISVITHFSHQQTTLHNLTRTTRRFSTILQRAKEIEDWILNKAGQEDKIFWLDRGSYEFD